VMKRIASSSSTRTHHPTQRLSRTGREHRKRQQGPKAKAKAKPTGPTWDNRFYLDRSLEAWEREERERGRREERRTPSRKRPQSASATLWRRQAPKPKPKTRPDLHVETAMQRRRRARPQSAGGRLRSPEVLIVTEPDPVAADDADALPFTTWDTFMEGPEAWETRAAAREAAAVGPAAAAAEEEEQQQAGEEGEASLQPSLEAIQACGAFAPLSGPEQQVFDAFVQMLKTKDAFASTCLVNLAHVTARSDDLLEFYGGGL